MGRSHSWIWISLGQRILRLRSAPRSNLRLRRTGAAVRDARFPVKISVAMLAYNHERFLAQALESALAQQTRFPFEIVLSEDCSSDRTREIAWQYAQAHPDRIRLLLSEKNLGLTRNTARTLDACRGEYVAILEGDD